MDNKGLHVDVRSFKRLKIELNKVQDQIPNATASALNRTLQYTKTNTDKIVREKYSVKSERVKKGLKEHKANKNDLNAWLESKDHTMTMASFPHNPQKAGSRRKNIKVRIKKNEGYKPISPSTDPVSGRTLKPFIQTSKNATLIWHRVGKNRFPIFPFRTLSVPQMISDKSTIDTIQSMAQKKLQERMSHEVNRRIDKAIKEVNKT